MFGLDDPIKKFFLKKNKNKNKKKIFKMNYDRNKGGKVEEGKINK